ncbi:MAG: FMN-binding protein, partial [Clostridia bacterium]|nr:FMN-binding protein [Clostridia bacterium]
MEAQKTRKSLPAWAILGIISLVAALALGLTNAVTEGPIREREAEELKATFSAVMPAESYEEISVPASGYDGVTNLVSAQDADGNLVGYAVKARAQGYGGPVAVTLGVSPSGDVEQAVIGDGDFAETDGFGARWRTEENMGRLVGLTTDGGQFEALSGATRTSGAVLTASNAAMKAVRELALKQDAADGSLVSFGKPEAADGAAAVTIPEDAPSASAKGFGGDVTVRVLFDEDGSTILGIAVDTPNETDGIGQRCSTDEFTAQFAGKTLPVTVGDGVDILSGATITSNAAIKALNSLASVSEPITVLSEGKEGQLGVTDSGAFKLIPSGSYSGETTVKVIVKNGAVTEAEIVPAAAAAPAGNQKSATAKGFGDGDVTVTVILDGNTITAIDIDAESQTPGLGQNAMQDSFKNQFIGKTIPVDAAEIDVIASATITTNAVIEAVNSLAGAAEAPAEAAGEQKSATAKGFGDGDVTVTVTLDGNTITVIDIDAESQTPGLGQNAMQDAFKNQFIGKTIPVDTAEIDVIASATITTNAVIEAVNSLAGAAEEAPAE